MEMFASLKNLVTRVSSPSFQNVSKIQRIKDSLNSLTPLTPEELDILNQENLILQTKEELTKKEAALESLTNSVGNAVNEVHKQEDLQKKLNRLLIFYNENLDAFTKQYLDSLSDLLSNIYQTVYENPNKSVKLCVEDSRGKKVISLITENVINGVAYPEDLTSASGSERMMLGMFLDIYYILLTGLPRGLFIDELFETFHDDTLARVFTLLQSFVDKMGFEFLIIDHNFNTVKKFATRIYTIDKGVVSEI